MARSRSASRGAGTRGCAYPWQFGVVAGFFAPARGSAGGAVSASRGRPAGARASDNANEPSPYSLPGHAARCARWWISFSLAARHRRLEPGRSCRARNGARSCERARLRHFRRAAFSLPARDGQGLPPPSGDGLHLHGKGGPRSSGGLCRLLFQAGFRRRSRVLPRRRAEDGRTRAQPPRGQHRPRRLPRGVAVARDLKAPLVVLHGAEDQLVNGGYFASVPMPTLWRGAVQTIPGAGHAPQWETPAAFDALVAAFIEETE